MNLKFNYAIVSILLTIDERKMTMKIEDRQFFKQNGYLPLGNTWPKLNWPILHKSLPEITHNLPIIGTELAIIKLSTEMC